MKIARLLFDLDGTISDPIEGIHGSINYALQSVGNPPLSMVEVAKYIGPPLDESFGAILGTSDQKLINELVYKYRESYRDWGFAKNRMYDGMKGVIAALSDRHIPMAICTLKIYEFAEKILTHFGIKEYFLFVSSGEIGLKKSEQIAKLLSERQIDSETIMIGDRSADLRAAHQNGISAAAVSWGYGSMNELQAEHPKYLLNSPSDLLKLEGGEGGSPELISPPNRIAIAAFGLESSTFTPLIASCETFTIKRDEFVHDSDLKVFREGGFEPVQTMLVSGTPSGVVPAQDFDQLVEELIQSLKAAHPFVGIFLSMHGSMLVSDGRHGELTLLTRVREEFGKDIPIAVRLDLHGNIPDGFVEKASVITALRTAPHRDGLETAQRCARLLIRVIKEKLVPENILVRVPLLFPGERVTTDLEPAKSLYQKIPELERDPRILAVNIMVGFAWADVSWAGASCIISTLDREYGMQAATDLAKDFFDARCEFSFDSPTCTVDEVPALLLAGEGATKFFSDSGDNVTAGAPGDSTLVLSTLLREKVDRVLLSQFYAPEAYRICTDHGVGAVCTISFGTPRVSMEGKVLSLEVHNGVGLATFFTQGCTLIVTEHRVPVAEPEIFQKLGLVPESFRGIIVKLGYLMPNLQDLARALSSPGLVNSYLILSPGPTTLDYKALEYRNVRRPLYPLDN